MRIRALSAIVAVASILSACATVPVKKSQAVPQPQWVTTTPAPTAEHTYFVGKGANASGNLRLAEDHAVHALVAEAMRVFRSAAGAATTPQVRAELDSLESRLVRSLNENEAGRTGDFSIAGRWVEQDGNHVVVSLLGCYATSALQEEKARVVSLERVRKDLAAAAEKHGDELLAQGRAYLAALKFIQAAAAANEANIANSQAEFESSMNKAQRAIATIHLETVNDNLHGFAEKPLPKPFVLEVRATVDGSSRPVSGARFKVTYPVPKSGGLEAVGTKSFTSGQDGRVTIVLPPPGVIGPQTVTVVLDLSRELDWLRHVAGHEGTLVESLQRRVDSVRAVFHYRTTSEAASIPTGVLVMDLDRGGAPIPGDDTAAGIERALTQAGFNILPIQSNPSILGIDNADLVTILRNNFGSKIKRAVIGQAQISGFEHSNNTYIVEVTGNVEVADLSNGKVLFSTSQVKQSRAGDVSSAINAAFRTLGTSIGNKIESGLR